MLPLIEQMLKEAKGEPLRYSTSQGPVVFFQKTDQVAAVLAENRLKRTDLLPIAFGHGIVVAEDGPKERRRVILQKQFGQRFVVRFVTELANVFAEKLDAWKGPAREVALEQETNRITLDIVSRAILSQPLGDGERLTAAITWAVTVMGQLANMALGQSCSLSPDFRQQLKQAEASFDSFILPIISAGRAGVRPTDDLLGLMLSTELDDREIRDEIVSLLLAGSETSALTLSWAQVELSRRPDVVERLRLEAEEVFPSLGICPEAVEKLPVASAVVNETLRLYPPVWQITRRAEENLTIVGQPVAAGTIVVVSPYLVHHDKGNWQNPEAFLPERFLCKGPASSQNKAHIPFSGGRHVCLGRKPALAETTLLLSLFARHLEIELLDQSHPRASVLTLRHAAPVRARLRVRELPQLSGD